MNKISVAIITFNEERNISDCIKSCLEIADEIVILDSFSTDQTEKFSKKFKKVKFTKQKFKGHIQQKNDAIQLCKFDWILSLDADERVSEELLLEIKKFKNSQIIGNGFKISRKTFHMGSYITHSGWYPLYRYRLFKKGKAVWKGKNPHDYIEIEGKGSKINGDIIHHSFKDLTDQIQTINKFSSIVAYDKSKNRVKFYIIKSVIKPISKFIEIYIVKKGFLDGYPGFVIAVSSAFSTFLKYSKMYELKKNIIQKPSNL